MNKILKYIFSNTNALLPREKTVPENEDLFRILFENSPIGMAIVNTKFYFVSVNNLFCRMLGYTEQELKKLTIKDITHPDYIAKDIDNIKKIITGEIPIYKTEKQYVCKNNTCIWGSLTVTANYTKEGKPLYLVAMIEDITERKRSEQLIIEREEIFKNFLENSPIYVFFKDQNIRPINLSKNYEQMLGMPLKDILGKTMDDLFPSDLAKSMIADDQRILHQREQVVVEEELNDRYYKTIKYPIFINGEPRYLGGFTIDITEQKQTEKALRESEERYRFLFERNPASMLIYSRITLKLLAVNDAFLNNYGYSSDEASSMTLPDLYPDDEKSAIADLANKIHGHAYAGEWHHIKKNGSIITIIAVSHDLEYMGQKARIAVVTDITERKKAEDDLKYSENRLQLSLKTNNASVFENNLKTGATSSTPELYQSLGYNNDEIPKTLEDTVKLIHPDDLPNVMTVLTDYLTGKTTEYYTEFRMITKSGEWRWVDGRGKVVEKDEKGEPVVLMGISRDIHARKVVEEALRIHRKEFQTYFDSSSIGLSVTTSDKSWIEVNHKLCKMLGYSKEELTGLAWDKLTHPDDLAENNEIFQQALEGKIDTYELDKRFIKKDGSTIYVTISTVCQRNEDGSIHHFLTSYIDITERKQNEKLVKTLSKAIEQSPTSIIITNAEGNIEFVNAKFTSFMQYTLDEVEGKKPRIFNPGNSSKETFETMWLTLKNGKIWQGEFNNRKKDETLFWENVIISSLMDNNNSISNYILIMEDITEKKKMLDDLISAKEKAEESDHLKTAFLHNISHEIRTPMNAIIGFSHIINSPDIVTEKRKQFTEIIIQSGSQLLSIIDDIISIATLEAGQTKININETNINSIVKLLYEQFVIIAHKQNISIDYHTSLEDADAYIVTDETKLTEILSNLINNALKFTKEGSIKYGYTLKNNNLEFYVEDTGIGISPEMHDKIFNRFHQVESTISRQYGGSGLGLSISKAYIELLGGTMWLSSESNKGSTFYFSIPYMKVTKTESLNNSTPNKLKIELKTSKTILVAEDEESNFILLKELLLGLDFNIIRAVTGIEAIKLCQNNPQIDIVLMDIKMLVMDGYEATKRIKELRPNLPVIAQTAYSSEIDKNKALASGCDDYISKPIQKDILLFKIKNLLDKT
jgi:PAS domain S-box-containing protein